jgi:hypothetical protein
MNLHTFTLNCWLNLHMKFQVDYAFISCDQI